MSEPLPARQNILSSVVTYTIFETNPIIGWVDAVERLDLRGRECPEPYIIVVRRFMSMKPGEDLEVVTDSWRCVYLIVESIKSTGLGSISVAREDSHYTIKLTRLK